jgi:hypothetical protein
MTAETVSEGATMDKGPWKVIPATGMRGGVCVASDDFTHDVLLRINGDFESDTQRLAYADWLAAKLNSTADQPSLRRCPDCDTPMWPAEFNVPCGRCATMKADQQSAKGQD